MKRRTPWAIGLLLAVSAQAMPPAEVPQPMAPSTLPPLVFASPYGLQGFRDDFDRRQRAPACPPREPSAAAADRTIDWCALAPYQPRYEPQTAMPPWRGGWW
ncbi:hypothetical protein [Nevskia sp.]|uniref:hypothetical protein n=1 Tax=Nevskia sp. TaxID=1929292 RepID=UPI0025D3E82A|nr:hypothetical protein [Nevskia sp.]